MDVQTPNDPSVYPSQYPPADSGINQNKSHLLYTAGIILFICILGGLILSIFLLTENEKRSSAEKQIAIINSLKFKNDTSEPAVAVNYGSNQISSPTPILTLVPTFAPLLPDYTGPFMYYYDKTGKLDLKIILGELKKDEIEAAFIFVVNGKESYSGGLPVTRLGNNTYRIKGTTTANYRPVILRDVYVTPVKRNFSIDGTFNVFAGEASLNITAGITNYILVQEGAKNINPLKTATQFMELYKQKDAVGMYNLMPPDVKYAQTQEQFVASMSAAFKNDPGSTGNLINYSFPKAGALEMFLYKQPVEFTAKNNDGSIKSYTMNLLLMKLPGDWRLLSMDVPIPKK